MARPDLLWGRDRSAAHTTGSCTRGLRIIPSARKPDKMPHLTTLWRGNGLVSHLLYYQRALLAIIWLFIMLHLTGSTSAAPPASVRAVPEPLKPKRQRANDPKAFEGLTHKPHCALCEQDLSSPQAPPPVPPDPMPPTNRRPHEIDTSQHFCPHAGCDYRGWLELGSLRANGHPSGDPWRQFHCTSCNGYFLETDGTIFHGKQATVELIVRVLACLAEG